MNWAVASRALEADGCGDGYTLVDLGDAWLVCVVDALGHGAEAEAVRDTALSAVTRNPIPDIEAVFASAHAALRSSRGAAMTLALIPKHQPLVSLAAVGNVEAVIAAPQGRKYVVGRGGVVGFKLPPIRITSYPMNAGDLLVLYTDGIKPSFTAKLDSRVMPEQLVASALEEHRSSNDDALVWAGRR